jgi:hypothetical protein
VSIQPGAELARAKKEAQMKRTPALLAVLLAAAGLVLAQEPAKRPLEYRFDEVKSKVLRSAGGDESRAARVAAGDLAEAGDSVRTGLFGRTLLSVPERAVRFEVFSSTRVRLAGPEPGVLLVLESGRLKAAFDAFTGASEERRVAAPGALLAVRGTRYGLEASPDGRVDSRRFRGNGRGLPGGRSPEPARGRRRVLRFRSEEPATQGTDGPVRDEREVVGLARFGYDRRPAGRPGPGLPRGHPGAPPLLRRPRIGRERVKGERVSSVFRGSSGSLSRVFNEKRN